MLVFYYKKNNNNIIELSFDTNYFKSMLSQKKIYIFISIIIIIIIIIISIIIIIKSILRKVYYMLICFIIRKFILNSYSQFTLFHVYLMHESLDYCTKIKSHTNVGLEPLTPRWKYDYRPRASILTTSHRSSKLMDLMVYKVRKSKHGANERK